MAVILLLASMKFLDLIIIRYWLCRLWLGVLLWLSDVENIDSNEAQTLTG